MINNWFICKVRFSKTMENGMEKKVTEAYLVDALSFTEAEARIIEEVTPFISGEFTISDISRYNVNEIFSNQDEGADRWFKAKVYFITLDEKTGCEKRTASYILVQGSDIMDAQKWLDESMKDTSSDYEVGNISETSIVDVFKHEEKKD